MKAKFVVILVMMLGVCPFLQAQDKIVDERVKLARQIYPERLEQIKTIRQYEADEIPAINYLTAVRKQNWAGSGMSTDKMEFYYHEIDDEYDLPLGYTLAMVRRTYNVGGRNFFEEFVYDDDGNPLFWFCRYDSFEGPKAELRGYFDADGTLLRTLDKNVTGDEDVTYNFAAATRNFPRFKRAFDALYEVDY